MAVNDDWSDFEEVEDEPRSPDPWASFEELDPATLKPAKASKKKKRKGRSSQPTRANDGRSVVDGDTLNLAGQTVRVWGADAPEMGQPGYPRRGAPVDLGSISRDAVATQLAGGTVGMGNPVGTSYGRTVAPLTVDGSDLALSTIRDGNAFAAPSFLAADPQRRFDYVQAERLARANELGPVNSFYTIPPEEFRRNPDWVPERETVAQFFDTPTPYSGLTAEQEAEWLRLHQEGSVEDLLKFAEANGFATDEDAARKWIEYRDKERAEGRQVGATVNYDLSRLNGAPVLTDDGRGQSGAAVRQAVQGFMAGGLDEAGAVFDMLGATPGRANVWNSDERWADLWARNRAQNASLLGYDEASYPTTSAVAQVGGAILQPFPAGKFASATRLGAWGGAYGAAEGFLGTEGGWVDRATNALIQTPVGVVVGAVGGKAIEAAAPHVARVMGRAGEGLGNITGGLVRRRGRMVESGEWAGFEDITDEVADAAGRGRSIAMEAEQGASLNAPARQRDYIDIGQPVEPQRMDEPLSDPVKAAALADVRPQDVLPVASNTVEDAAEAAAIDAGRVKPARPVDERKELKRTTIRNYMGVAVPKVGPVDMVGWLRTQGGLLDQGGELAHMGITNAARKGMEHVGQEHRFGPIVNSEGGLSLDDAALRAWEAGYFPDHTERPTVNEFLDALQDTYEGGPGRRFLPEDLETLDRYDAARTDRLDLEKRIAEDGPVYVDRSVPADEPQPLPPVEAYEDWGPKAPDFVGNLNLSKLETPQDIARALVQSHNRVGGFDAATRGRITQVETERLAAELNMTPDALLKRRKGQAFNAEEALAARQILAKSSNELVNAARSIQRLEDPGDELLAEFYHKLVLHNAIQEQVAGMTAEAGRALAQFKQVASSKAVSGKVLHALVRSGGGKDGLKDAAETLLEAAETSPGKFAVTSRHLQKPRWQRVASELYINFLLSNPATHAVNMTSNMLTAIGSIPEYATASVIGKARQALDRGAIDRVTGSEVGSRAFGLLSGTRDGARLFARALRTGEPSDLVAKVEGQEWKAIPGVTGEVIRLPTRLLTAEDELFKGIARRMALNGLAARKARMEGLKGDEAAQRIAELMLESTEDMLEMAIEEGLYRTFQNKLGPMAQDVSNFANRTIWAKVFLPFIRTPTNLLKYATERSPAAPMLKEWRADFRAGGARRDLAVAKSMLGTGFGMAVYEAAANGLITGSAPSDPKKARLLYADGWKPYSIKVGDTYYSYRRLDPFAITIGTFADIATLPEGMSKREQEDAVALGIASIMGNLASKTWLSGVSDVVNALHEPGRYTDRLMQRLVGSFLVPAGVAGLARTLDPVQREVEGYSDALKARVPGLSDDLLPRRDIWGRPITNEGGIGPDFLSPVYISTALKDPVNKALLQLDYAPSYPSNTVGGVELSPEQYDRYLEASGKGSHDRLNALVASPEWRNMSDVDRVKAAKREVRLARKEARESLFDVGADAEDIEDEPAPARGEPDPWSGFETVPQRDVVAELSEAIPGVQFTSGYRTPEYQADMRRRGYKPASNSAHLDGSGLDMLPPPGRSLAWLRARVKSLEPNARLSIHDGHLHATFPDYFAAPAIGGAVSAGLKNPVRAGQ